MAPISSFVLRPFRMAADVPAAAEILNLRAELFDDPHRWSGRELAQVYETQANFDPAQDALVATANDVMVGFADVDWSDEPGRGLRVYRHRGHVHPARLREGIGRALLRWIHGRVTDLTATHRHHPAEMRTDANDGDHGAALLLPTFGYRAAASGATLVRPHLGDIPEAPLPPGLEIRPVHEDHFRAVYEADIEAFADHRGFTDQGEDGWRRFRHHPSFDPSLWKVAWSGDEVAGQVRTFVNPSESDGRRRAWTEDISVRRRWRNQGVARALLCASLRDLRERGFEEAALEVHVENPGGAFHLYTDLGYRVVSTSTEWVRAVRRPGDQVEHHAT